MPVRKLLIGILFLFTGLATFAQSKNLLVDIFSNATALPTRPRQIFEPIHPGITLGIEFRYGKDKNTVPEVYKKHVLAQTLKLGFSHHRLVKSDIQLYSELRYSYRLTQRLRIDVLGGAGYVHSFSDNPIYVWKDSVYVRKANLGKPRIMGAFSLGPGYFIGKNKKNLIFINYRFSIHTPFINEYVPLLPNTSLHIGVSIPIPTTQPYTF